MINVSTQLTYFQIIGLVEGQKVASDSTLIAFLYRSYIYLPKA